MNTLRHKSRISLLPITAGLFLALIIGGWTVGESSQTMPGRQSPPARPPASTVDLTVKQTPPSRVSSGEDVRQTHSRQLHATSDSDDDPPAVDSGAGPILAGCPDIVFEDFYTSGSSDGGEQSTFEPGDEIHFVFEVNNDGETAEDVVTELDTADPNNDTVDDLTGYCDFNIDPGGWILSCWGNIPNDAIAGQYDTEGTLRCGSLSSSKNTHFEVEIPTPTPTRTPTMTSTPAPGIRLNKTLLTDEPLRVGDTIEFEILLENNGETQLNTIELTDVYDPKYLTYLSANPPASDSINDGRIEWDDLDELDLRDEMVVSVSFLAVGSTTPNANDRTINEAQVSVWDERGSLVEESSRVILTIEEPATPATSATPTPSPTFTLTPTPSPTRVTSTPSSTPTSTPSTSPTPTPTPTGEANLSTSVKDVDHQTAFPGDRLRYTLVLRNSGNAAANACQVTDRLPSSVDYEEGTLAASSGNAAWDRDGRQITWEGSVTAGETVAITFSVRVKSSTPNGSQIRNVATIYDGTHLPFDRFAETEINRPLVFLPLLMRDFVGEFSCRRPQNAVFEPNDNFSQAFGPLCPGQDYRDILTADDLHDIYFIEASGDFEVSLSDIGVGEDYDLAVYASTSSPPIESSQNPGNRDEYVAIRGAGPGRYYIQVFRFDGADGAPPYRLYWRRLN